MSLSGINLAIMTLFMFSEASTGRISYQKRFKSSRTQYWYKNVVHPGISFQFVS